MFKRKWTRIYKVSPKECLVQLVTLVLKHNNLTLNGEHSLQINGTTMGTPSYANIFMGKLEKLIIQFSPYKPLSWFRFIDDVDMKWTESEENLNRFFDHANNVYPTIKFTHETSRNNISFLDTYTTCENCMMSTDIYISTCPHRVVIQNIAPKVFRTSKLYEWIASAPMNKLQKMV